MLQEKIKAPQDGIKGLKENFGVDFLSGFMVFLLALPLSLGIAKASEFPTAMGVLTAMIGGLFVSLFMGARMTIKGPAAGLITVCAAAVTEMGGGIAGWQMAAAAIVVTGVIQYILGWLKVGKLSDFFPHSAVHGMLAAIGILIFAKQFPILLGVDPALLKGLSPIELYTHIPQFISKANPTIALVGIMGLAVLFGLPLLGKTFKKVPGPLVVLLIAVPIAIGMDFKTQLPEYSLVKIGDFWSTVKLNADFSLVGTFVFWKYVFMFLFVNSLESLLTVKAIDGQDPFKRKSDYDKDLRAVGMGNSLSGFLGGLPMISEVARSAANVNFGGRTRWANFFHGFFLLIAMLLMIPVIELIPNSALAAMLIFVAYRLASPKEFIGVYKVGPEQLVIFCTTILVTVLEDLLLGIAAGILVKFIFHLANGAKFSSLFKAKYSIKVIGDQHYFDLEGSAVFSNLIAFKHVFEEIPPRKIVIIDFSKVKFIDHSFMDFLERFEEDYHYEGGRVTIVGFEKFKNLSKHHLSARKKLHNA